MPVYAIDPVSGLGRLGGYGVAEGGVGHAVAVLVRVGGDGEGDAALAVSGAEPDTAVPGVVPVQVFRRGAAHLDFIALQAGYGLPEHELGPVDALVLVNCYALDGPGRVAPHGQGPPGLGQTAVGDNGRGPGRRRRR